MGEKLGEYYEGVPAGAFAVLARKHVIYPKEEPAPDFLLSLVQTNQTDAKSVSTDISETMEAALASGFSCRQVFPAR